MIEYWLPGRIGWEQSRKVGRELVFFINLGIDLLATVSSNYLCNLRKKKIKKKMKYSSYKGKRSIDAVRLCQSLSRSEPSACGRFLPPLSPSPWAEVAG